MSIEVISKIVQKNGGTFKLIDANNVDYDGTGTSSIKDKIDNHELQLADNTNQINLFKDSKRAKIGISIKWLPTQSTIDNWVANGIEEITYIPMIQYSSSLSDWIRYYPTGSYASLAEYMVAMKNILNYAHNKGIKVVCVKIHSSNETSEADQTQVELNLTNFKTKYKQYMLDIYNEIKNEPFFTNVDYYCVLNEKEYMYGNATSYESFILDLISTMKGYGFKVGVSTAEPYYSVKKLSVNVRNVVDCFFINHYPSLSFKGNKATIDDCINGWNSMQNIAPLENLKADGKEIIMSETGVLDYYEYLASPSSYNWDTGSLTPSVNGEVGILYIGSLFQSEEVKCYSKVWLMFEDTFLKPDVKTYFDKYKGGAL